MVDTTAEDTDMVVMDTDIPMVDTDMDTTEAKDLPMLKVIASILYKYN